MTIKPLRKAVFPVGGLGTRFLPATKAMPKEMLPVVDRPLIQYAVDEAIEAGISFPPDDFMMRLARATQHLYFPEHLPDLSRPAGLPGAGAFDRARGLSECYGTLRAGNLVELLLYDCRRFTGEFE